MADVLTRCVPKTGHIQRFYVAISAHRPLAPYIMTINFDCQCRPGLKVSKCAMIDFLYDQPWNMVS